MLALLLVQLAALTAACKGPAGTCGSNKDCSVGDCKTPDPIRDSQNLLQTFHQVQAHKALIREARHNATIRALADNRLSWDNLCIQPLPLHLQLGIESIRAMGYAPSRSACAPRDLEEGGRLALTQVGMSKTQSRPWGYEGFVPLAVLAGHVLLTLVGAVMIFRSVLWSPPKHTGPASEDPEVLAWRHGCLRWLLLDWVSGWVAKWGTSANRGPTKIRADEVTVLASPEDACEPCFRRFEQLWRQEIEREGLEQASLLKVVIRFVTYRKVFAIIAWNAVYESCLFIGPPLAIEWIVTYANWLYVERMEGMVIPQSSLVRPSILTIALFTGLPVVVAASTTISNMIDARIGARVTGALASAVLRKGQLLPASPQACSFDPDRPSEDPMQKKIDAGWEVPQRYNLVQLVMSDVASSIMAIPLALARVVVMVPVMLVMFGLLCRKLRWAFVFCVILTVPMVSCVVAIGGLQKRYLLSFMNLAGRRLQAFQQILFGIRVLKSFGGEGLCQGRLELIRRKELQALNGYYALMCFMFQAQWQFPRLYLAASLGGYILVHGDIPVTSIIAIIPLLSSFQSCVGSVLGLIPTLVSARPSCMRLAAFLKLPEAPCFLPLTNSSHGASKVRRGIEASQTPTWITTWPAPTAVEEAGLLRVEGSFSFRQHGVAAVRDLHLAVPRGQLVAILGPPGAGKTALLHALLGELHPIGGAKIQVPGKIAYSAQVPHIMEGTLKENILYMDPYEEERYTTAVHAAGLLPDLEVLPGQEDVPIGSRGVALSGGQRTRISLARAAYSKDADVLLLDDIYGPLDSRTAAHVNEHLLCGQATKGRTRIVVGQPVPERLAMFDRIIVMWGGRIEADGTLEEVKQTNAYKKLLSTSMAINSSAVPTTSALNPPESAALAATRLATKAAGPVPAPLPVSTAGEGREVLPAWEEEPQGRASWETVEYFVYMGGRFYLLFFLVLFLMKKVFDMAMNMVLASWMTDGSLASFKATKLGFQEMAEDWEEDSDRQRPKAYLLKFCFWWTLSISSWFACWVGGHIWTLNISRGCHTAMVNALMRAPVDKFFDRTPVGRIMNRASNDMMNVDLQVFTRLCAIMGMVWSVVVPLVYVHIVMPPWFSIASLPCYYILLCLLRMYWKTMVPLRYLSEVCKSTVNAKLAEVEANNPSVRAYRKSDVQLAEFQHAIADLIGARFASGTALRCWLTGRLLVLGGFFVTTLALLIIWVPGVLDVGRASLCLMGVFSILSGIEGSIEVGASAQYQLIAMNRIHEYTRLPEEREEVLVADRALSDLSVSTPRSALESLVCRRGPEGVEVVRANSAKVVLKQVPGKAALVAVPGFSLGDLAPECSDLRLADGWHRIVSCNDVCNSAEEMAEELCNGSSVFVHMQIRSGWLADGVAVKIHQLRAAYASTSNGDILQGVDLSIPRRCKAALVGEPGSGKTTMLLCIIRMLEPVSGRILLEGVSTQRVGLRTLRAAVGLVPQDPLLLQGSLRSNLDPFGQFDDARLWEALRLVQMEDHMKACEGGLDLQVAEDGTNISFGHRQLLCLARLVLRQPSLLLLDDAFSALDFHTQEVVRCKMWESFPDSTILAVESRLQSVSHFDLVAVMEHGRVVEQGHPKELLEAKDGFVSRMIASEKALLARMSSQPSDCPQGFKTSSKAPECAGSNAAVAAAGAGVIPIAIG